MGDVADILGLRPGKPGAVDPLSAALGEAPKPKTQTKARKKPPGMSREVYALLGKQGLAPVMPTKKPSLFKDRRGDKDKAAKWVWAPFSNSARKDGAEFFHWVKADVEYPEYPYARYNIKLDPRPSKYSNEEYADYLEDPKWTRKETDRLVELCMKYDLRWPVIFDSWDLEPPRPVEELQHRFYSLVSMLQVGRAGQADAGQQAAYPGMQAFNLEYEQKRRQQLEVQFRKNRAGEEEEESLREELKSIEAQIKKLKQRKDTGKIVEELAVGQELRKGIRNQAPARGRPYLQSHRLTVQSQTPAAGLSKQLLKKLKQVLAELHVPEKPVCSKQVCDLMDNLKKDIITMLSLKKIASHKEAELLAHQQQKEQMLAGQVASSAQSANVAASMVMPTMGAVGMVQQQPQVRQQPLLQPQQQLQPGLAVKTHPGKRKAVATPQAAKRGRRAL